LNSERTIKRPRATIHIYRDRVEKHFRNPKHAAAERYWYTEVPWACPKLLSHSDTHITIERGTPATDMPDWHPLKEIRNLLMRLEKRNIHHRDVWPGNIIQTTDGPKLIDWETATQHTAPHSYDLHGPRLSGIPIPDIHQNLNGYVMWWGSEHPKSLCNTWIGE
jgi:hypothetical protein